MSIPHTPAEMYPLSHPQVRTAISSSHKLQILYPPLQFHRMLGYPRYDYTKYPVEANRAGLAKVLNYPRPDTEVYASKDYFIKGGRGQEMRVLAVRPAGHPLVGNGSDKIPVILALHGGGGVMGMPELVSLPSLTSKVLAPKLKKTSQNGIPILHPFCLKRVYRFLTSVQSFPRISISSFLRRR